MEQHMDIFLSLYKLYLNYLEVVQLNNTVEKLEKEHAKKNCAKNDNGRKIKGLKRKFLDDSEVSVKNDNLKKSKIETRKKLAILEKGDGVTEDELHKSGISIKNSKAKPRRFWVNEENKGRDKSGYFVVTYLKLKDENSSDFFDLTRMDRSTYDILLEMVRDDLTKTSIRSPIESECRLAVTLIYLSQGTPFFQLAKTFQMGKSTIREIVYDTCNVIWKTLSPKYVKKLNAEEYENITKGFYDNWSLPNCVGVFDSRMLDISLPSRQINEFGDKVKYMSFSFTCSSNYEISWCDVRPYSPRCEQLLEIFNGQLDIPSTRILPNSNISFPYYFVGDIPFPFKEQIMRPYTINKTEVDIKQNALNKSLSPSRNIVDNTPDATVEESEEDLRKITFNRYMSTARNIVDNTFGVLISRWSVLQTEFKCCTENCKKLCLAVVALHNFIMESLSKNTYCPKDYIDYIDYFGNFQCGEWRKEVKKQYQQSNIESNSSRNAMMMRDVLARYFYLNEMNFQTDDYVE